MRVTLLQPLYDPNGILLPAGSIQYSINSLSYGLLKSWCTSGQALDMDGYLVDAASVTDANPPTTMTDYSPYGYGPHTTVININTPAGGTLNSLLAEGHSLTNGSGTVQIVNTSAVNSLSIAHLGPSNLPTYFNQFQCMGGAAVTLLPLAGAYAVRNSANTYWGFR